MKTKAMTTAVAVLTALLMMPPARGASAADSPAPTPAAPADAVEGSTTPPQVLTLPPNLVAVDPLTLEGASFYEVVGRPDLADRYRHRRGLKTTSRIVGGVTLGVGLVAYAVVATLETSKNLLSQCGVHDTTGNCATPSTLWGPDVMMAAGLAMLVVPAFISDDPVSEGEKRSLAHAGAAQPTSLGLAFVPAAPSTSTFTSTSATGGSLLLSGRF